MIAECNSHWQNITCTGRIWLILAEHDLYWQNLTSIGRISLLPAEYDFHWQNMIYTVWLSGLAGRIWLILGLPSAEYDLYWLIVTLTGRICSQSKVFCRYALLCRFNIPAIIAVKNPAWFNNMTALLEPLPVFQFRNTAVVVVVVVQYRVYWIGRAEQNGRTEQNIKTDR